MDLLRRRHGAKVTAAGGRRDGRRGGRYGRLRAARCDGPYGGPQWLSRRYCSSTGGADPPAPIHALAQPTTPHAHRDRRVSFPINLPTNRVGGDAAGSAATGAGDVGGVPRSPFPRRVLVRAPLDPVTAVRREGAGGVTGSLGNRMAINRA